MENPAPTLTNSMEESEYDSKASALNAEFITDHQLKPTDVELDPPQRITDDALLNELELHRSKGFFQRNFSPITKGGIRSSVFTLFSGTVGAGVLSLPHVKTC
jgi:hypothetical protein